MKYRTFRALVLFGLTGAGLFGWLVYTNLGPHAAPPPPPPAPDAPSDFPMRSPPPSVPAPPPSVPAPPPAAEPAPPPAPAPAPTSDELSLREMDRRIVSDLLGKPSAGAKEKDAFPSSKERVSVYTDEPATTPTRIKIDLDRDDKVDEKWEIDGAKVTKRLVSTRDDEVYDEVWKLEGETWIRTRSGLSPDAKPHATSPGPRAERTPLRPVDHQVLRYLGKPAQGDRIKDALGKGQPKVNVSAENGATVWNYAKLDPERNEKWNEKYDWKDGKVTRRVAPKDDEVYTKKYRLEGEEWVEVLEK